LHAGPECLPPRQRQPAADRPDQEPALFGGPANGGRIQEFDRDGKIVWDYKLSNDKQLPHHDICPLPNGNVLMIVWEKKTAREAIAAGRRPETVKDHLLADCVLEVKPTGKTTGEIVWEWHPWDHLIQDFDSKKPTTATSPPTPNCSTSTSETAPSRDGRRRRSWRNLSHRIRRQRRTAAPRVNPDWLHLNAVAYNAELDQVNLSVFEFSEI
jgi:hypothetical protein